jgi:hypothetical protein
MSREKELIRSILRENVVVTEDGETQSSSHYAGDETTEKATDGDYERVRGILENDLINHAGVILRLWGSKDATKRSLFRKKLHKEQNDGGGTYEFDKDEMTKLISILDNLSKDISSHVNINQ